MRILSLAVDADGSVHLAAVRAPDLWRRDIAAATGAAHLVFVGLVPANVGIEVVLARLDDWLARTGVAPATLMRYANAPTRVISADPGRIARWLQMELAERKAGILDRVLVHIRRGSRRYFRRALFAIRSVRDRGLIGRSVLGREALGRERLGRETLAREILGRFLIGR